MRFTNLPQLKVISDGLTAHPPGVTNAAGKRFSSRSEITYIMQVWLAQKKCIHRALLDLRPGAQPLTAHFLYLFMTIAACPLLT